MALAASLFLATANLQAQSPGAPPRPEIVSHIRRLPVNSTALASIGYSRSLRALEIEFRNGAIYRYLNVDPSAYRDLMSAASKARYYDQNIRKKYRSLHVKARRE
jgi:hypothetical protein